MSVWSTKTKNTNSRKVTEAGFTPEILVGNPSPGRHPRPTNLYSDGVIGNTVGFGPTILGSSPSSNTT